MMLRAFIAVEIPAGIQSAIAHSTASLKNALPKSLVRWVAPQNVHLTLKFLGDVSPANLEQLAEALKVEAASHGMFSMSVGGLGAFPTPRRARVIWIGLEAPPALEALRRGVEAAAAQLGYAPEERPFSPHLTIGRVGQNVICIGYAAHSHRARSYQGWYAGHVPRGGGSHLQERPATRRIGLHPFIRTAFEIDQYRHRSHSATKEVTSGYTRTCTYHCQCPGR